MTEHPPPSSRLSDARAPVRRIAIRDLIALAERGDAGATAALTAHLARERDEAALLLVIRALARLNAQGAAGYLARLRDDSGSSPAVAHAALLAHDELEVRRRPPPPPPDESLAPEDLE